MNVSAVREAASGNKSQRGGYSEQAQYGGGRHVRPRTAGKVLLWLRIPRRWHSRSWARQVAGPQQPGQRGWEGRPGPWWAVQGVRRGGGNTERVSHRFWARPAVTAERGAHSWLAGRPALMSFPHGPELPARHDHTGKTLPRPPPPQLPPSHRTAEGEGGECNWASRGGPGPLHGAWLPGSHRGRNCNGFLARLSPPCPGLHTGEGGVT